MYKNTLSAICFMLIATHCCFSQSGVNLGLKGGISIPNLKSSGDNPVSKGWSSRSGFYGGIVAEVMVTDRFFLQAELNYASQGGKRNGAQAFPSASFASQLPPGFPLPAYFYADYNTEARLNYLELPVMLKVEFPLGEALSFFINGGPYAGYLLNAKNISHGSSNVYIDENLTQPVLPAEVSFESSTDIKDQIKNLNFGIQGAVGLSLLFENSNKLILSGGGNYGVVNIQKDAVNGKNNTGAATVTLAYLFAF